MKTKHILTPETLARRELAERNRKTWCDTYTDGYGFIQTRSNWPALYAEDERIAMLPEADSCDPHEAPIGYVAVPKPRSSPSLGNICNHCDWRKTCQDPNTDLLAPGHRCMSYPTRAYIDGRVHRRKDRCSVVFKRREGTATHQDKGPDGTVS